MAKTPLFGRLKRHYLQASVARRLGTSDPRAIAEGVAQWQGTRRTALQAVSALTVAMVAACGDDPKPTTRGAGRVVVIGGGMAGLHCAYRLDKAGVDVVVFESADRVGGRMFTGRDLFEDGQVCELGGELIDTNHATLWALSEELDIALDDRFADEPAGFKREQYVIGGVEVPESTIVDQFTEVAPIMASAVEAADSDDAAFEELDNTSLDAWLIANVPPADYPELHAILQVAYRGEFGLENDQQSALNLLYLIDSETPDPFHIFGDSDERYHAHDGNDVFPVRLAEALGDKVVLSTALVAARKDGDGYVLDFDTGRQERADHVVFALPFSVLRSLDIAGLELSEEKQEIIDNLDYGTNAKVMGGFTAQVWREAHNASGALTIDNDVQQTWSSSIGQSGESGILTNFLGGDRGMESQNGTPEAWLEAQLTDLELVWPGVEAAFTGTAVRMHWPTAAGFLGSYTCYSPGQWAFWSLEGVREGNVHFCGEHTSLDFQGWMEGAAETGALVAAEILEDLGGELDAQHVQALGIKLLVPQACYRAHRWAPTDHSAGSRRTHRKAAIAALLER